MRIREMLAANELMIEQIKNHAFQITSTKLAKVLKDCHIMFNGNS